MNNYHSVTLDVDECRGCTNCIKGCPTEAIRVRDSKAFIIESKCIDCGECIRICPNKAKYASTDKIQKLKEFKFNIALPPPSLFGQFKVDTSTESVIYALKKLGFDEVYEVALAAEKVSVAIRDYLKNYKGIKPLISSSCPAIIRLIQVRFPELIKNIIPIKAPMEIAARDAKNAAAKKYGISKEDIGVFFISPCPAKVTAVKQPLGSDKSHVDGVLSIAGIYADIVKNLQEKEVDSIFEKSSGLGVGWGRSGGENIAIGGENHLAVDGIQNCIDVLEEVEMNKLSDIDYIECQACIGGCVGGALTVENQFVARVKIRRLADKLGESSSLSAEDIISQYNNGYFSHDCDIPPKASLRLDEDIVAAIRKMEKIERTVKQLPGLDCGSCGAPNCRALAEDIAQGLASETDCLFILRDRVTELATEMLDLSKKLPPTLDSQEKGR